jgi:preprotein translocase subunit YajC
MPTTHALFAVLMAAASTSKKTTTTSSSVGTLLFIVVIFGLVYMFFLRPRTQAARRQRDTLMELSTGDEVLTGAGIFGTVLDVEADRVTLETAPGTRITVVRSTIARRISEAGGSSVAEQNWHDEGHDGVAEAAAWHDPSEQGEGDHGSADDPDTVKDDPEADGATDSGKGSGQ